MRICNDKVEMVQAAKQRTANGAGRLNALFEVRSEAFAPTVSSASLAWSGFRLERHRIFANAATPKISLPTHVIGFLLDGAYKKDISVIGGLRTVAHIFAALRLTLLRSPQASRMIIRLNVLSRRKKWRAQ